jgi:multiple antibiotic resistance protein
MANVAMDEFLKVAVMLFMIIDPIGNIPIFNRVLRHVPEEKRSLVIVRELIVAYIILVVFLFAGEAILGALGLKQPALQVTSGIVLFLIGIDIVFPGTGKKTVDAEKEDPFIVPLAMPLVAGPSALATLMIFASKQPEKIHIWWAALTAAWALCFVILVSSKYMLRLIGQRGIRAVEKLIGMLLIMLSVQFFLDGIMAYIQQGPA